jgi:predicted dehydrogenase
VQHVYTTTFCQNIKKMVAGRECHLNGSPQISRRKLLSGAAAVGGVSMLPSWALATGRISPNDKANIAFIGIGNYGAVNLVELASQNIVAVCDVDWRDRSQVPGRGALASEVAQKYPQAQRFDDWRVMLEKMDKRIDGVVVCTADHTHAVAALTAMKMGKHVYCEKPLAHSIDDVRAMVSSAQAHGHQATQTGVVGHASEDVRRIVEWVRDGAIGTVQSVEVFQSRWESGRKYQSPYDEIQHVGDGIAIPAEVKWDLWLGPAPRRAYNPMYLPLRWRNWIDFGTGILGDHGPHFLDPVVWALDLEYPDQIEAETDPEYDQHASQQMFPGKSKVRYRFPARGNRAAVSLTWYGYDTPPIPEGWKKDEPFPNGGGILHGTKGKIVYGPVYSSLPGAPKQVWLLPEELDRAYKRPTPTLSRPRSHWLEWIDAARTGKQTSANWQYGGLITEICLLGNIAIAQRGTSLIFAPKTRRFTNSSAANDLFHRPSREGWQLPV